MIQEGDYIIRYDGNSAILWFFKFDFEIKASKHDNRIDNLIMAFTIAECYMSKFKGQL